MMSKKKFGFDSLLGESKVEREKDLNKKPEKKGKEPQRSDEVRATFIVKRRNLEKLKAMAYWERKLIKEELNEAIEDRIRSYERKKGKEIEMPGK